MTEPYINLGAQRQSPGWLSAPSYNYTFDWFFSQRTAPLFVSGIRHKLLNTIIEPSLYPEKPFSEKSLVQLVDVPDYMDMELSALGNSFTSMTIPQYQGFLVNLQAIDSVDQYLQNQLSSRNRKNLRSKERKLLGENQIRYQYYFGEIDQQEYDRLFDDFYTLLERRFEEKELFNRNLLNWRYYYEIAYPLILQKKAMLFVIYDRDKPITLTLNFLFNKHLFSYIQTYDIEYSQYNMGDISMVRHLEWCLMNDILIFDLGKGINDYKLKWTNHHYQYHYQIYFKKKAGASSKARFLMLRLRFQQYLRDKGVLGGWFQYDHFFFKRQSKKIQDYDWRNDVPN